MSFSSFCWQLFLGLLLLILQTSFCAEIFYQLFPGGALGALRFNFLFLIAVYFGLYRDLGEGLIIVFLLGVVAGILSPFLFSFYPSYAIGAFLLSYFISRFFLVRQLRLAWVFVFCASLSLDAGFLLLLGEVKDIYRPLGGKTQVLLLQATLNVFLFPFVRWTFYGSQRFFEKRGALSAGEALPLEMR